MRPTHGFQLILLLLTIALVLPIAARRLPLPPAASLVLGGMLLAFLPGMPAIEIESDLAMVLFLPPLLLSSAVNTIWRDFRAELRSITLLAVGAVTFTTGLVGLVAHALLPALPWGACFALGAVVSPPDAVAVKGLLHGMPLPRRTLTILEGESLVNDASGLVLYRFAIAAVLTQAFKPTAAILTFVWVSVGGVLAGLAAGWLFIWLVRHLKSPHENVILSFLCAWVTYIVADTLALSGVLAVVACGLMISWRQHDAFTANDRVQIGAVWDVVVTIFETLVFVLVGLALRAVLNRAGGAQHTFEQTGLFALVIVAAVVGARLLWVIAGYLIARIFPLPRSLRETDFPTALIIGWAGMRGGVSLAAVLALPRDFPGRDIFIFTTFAVIAATVLLQGSTLGPIARFLLRSRASAPPGGLAELEARVRMSRASLQYLETLAVDQDSGPFETQRLIEMYRNRLGFMERVSHTVAEEAGQQRESYFSVALAALHAGRLELISMHREGAVHDSILRAMEAETDLEELRLRHLRGGQRTHG